MGSHEPFSGAGFEVLVLPGLRGFFFKDIIQTVCKSKLKSSFFLLHPPSKLGGKLLPA
jgi:hypothetical protein